MTERRHFPAYLGAQSSKMKEKDIPDFLVNSGLGKIWRMELLIIRTLF
jgi:hypothetical protein